MKYVRLQHVQELVALIKKRDKFNDWSTEYKKYDNKIKNTIDWLERNAKEIEEFTPSE